MMPIQKQLVQEILDGEDVEGLLALGAPADEYSHEAERVTAALRRWQGRLPTESDIVHVLEAIWADAFGPLSEEEIGRRLPSFGRIARRLSENLAGSKR